MRFVITKLVALIVLAACSSVTNSELEQNNQAVTSKMLPELLDASRDNIAAELSNYHPMWAQACYSVSEYSRLNLISRGMPEEMIFGFESSSDIWKRVYRNIPGKNEADLDNLVVDGKVRIDFMGLELTDSEKQTEVVNRVKDCTELVRKATLSALSKSKARIEAQKGTIQQ